MIKLKQFVFNELGVNCFVLHDDTQRCIIVDPGCNSTSQQTKLSAYITENNLTPDYIVNTHGHFDHVFGNSWAKSVYICPILMHRDDLHLIEHIDKFAGLFGFEVDKAPFPDRFLYDGELLEFGETSMKIIHVPGHSPGSICLYSETDRLLISGDVLFNGGVGRTDLPAGNHGLLMRGIREKILTLPPDTVVWPGHGPQTTIRNEHDTNPFLT
jgi:glyoxylase-like metal-dependent hydrolase (beta-lactamase superfamily II)